MRRFILTLPVLLALVLSACAPAAGPSPAAPSKQEAPPAEKSAPTSAPAPKPAPTTAPAAKAAPKELQNVKVGLNTTSVSVLPYYVAKDAGIFEKHGLDVEFVIMQTSSQVAPALISGELGLSNTAAAGMVSTGVKGADTLMISGHGPFLRFFMYGAPGIESVADLRGKKAAVTRAGGGLHLATVLAVEKAGMTPGRDVAIIQAGNNANILAALVSGQVEAGTLTPPTSFQAEDKGFKLLVDTLEWKFPYILGGIGTTRTFVEKNPELVRNFTKAYVEGLARAISDREFALKVLSERSKIDDRKLLERTYDTEVPSWRFPPYPVPEAVQSVLDQLAERDQAAKTADANKFIDQSPMKELETSGFIKSLGVEFQNWP